MASIGPVGGGAGGGPKADGVEACGANMSYLKNTPVEINEAEVPIRIRRYGLVPDSGGAGFYRGGSALEMEFQLFAPQSMVTARNRDRSRFEAWGLAGGKSGKPSRFTRNPDTPNAVELGSTDVVHCDPGDIILIQGPGAGGYGDALQRPVDKVRLDVARGFVSHQSARNDYGVIIGEDLQVDEKATEALRAELAAAGPSADSTGFGYGPERIAYERIWTEARYAALTDILSQLPVSWRYFIKHQIFRAIGEEEPASPGDGSDVYGVFAIIARQFPDLPGVTYPTALAAE